MIPAGCTKINLTDLDKQEDVFDLIYISVGNFTLNNEQLIHTNLDIPKKVLQKFKSSRVIFMSSISIYGNHQEMITLTSSSSKPTLYGFSKLKGEAIVSKHPKYSIIRFTNLYGIGMNEKSFITNIIKDGLTQKKITLTNRGERKHDYLHVEDAADLCIKVGENNENRIYLGATGISFSNLEIAQIIQKLIPGCEIEFRDGETAPSYFFEVDNTMEKLEWKPQKKLEEGLKELVEYYENIGI